MNITIVTSPSGRLESSMYVQLGLVEYAENDDGVENDYGLHITHF